MLSYFAKKQRKWIWKKKSAKFWWFWVFLKKPNVWNGSHKGDGPIKVENLIINTLLIHEPSKDETFIKEWIRNHTNQKKKLKYLALCVGGGGIFWKTITTGLGQNPFYLCGPQTPRWKFGQNWSQVASVFGATWHKQTFIVCGRAGC